MVNKELTKRKNWLLQAKGQGYTKRDGPCTECGAQPIYARRVCRQCYVRLRNVNAPRPQQRSRTCETEGCLRPVVATGLCGTCYQRQYRRKQAAGREFLRRHLAPLTTEATDCATCTQSAPVCRHCHDLSYYQCDPLMPAKRQRNVRAWREKVKRQHPEGF